MKKYLLKITTSLLLVSFALIGCNKTNTNPYEGDQRYDIYQMALAEGYEGTYEQWLASIRGQDGKDGAVGKNGQDGKDGEPGLSAYEIFLKYHPEYKGTEEEWIEAIVKGDVCSLLGHQFEDKIVAATCEKDGYTLHECTRCGYSYTDNVVESTGHDYQVAEHKDYMGSTSGYDKYVCTHCGDSYVVEIPSPIHKVSVWDGETRTKPTTLVQVDNVYYYQIDSASELAYIVNEGDSNNNNYILNTDIVLNDCDLTYSDNGKLTVDSSNLNVWDAFRCQRFDGNGFKISGVYSETGFITCCYYLSNLTIDNSYICSLNNDKSTGNIGGIANRVIDSGENGNNITNCIFTGCIKSNAKKHFVGGIVGDTSLGVSIFNCISNGLIMGTNNVGGICGSTFYSSISYCTNNAIVIGEGYVGGITGTTELNSTVKNCTNNGNVSGSDSVGGIIGRNCYSLCKYSKNYGLVNGEKNVGGICGYNEWTVSNCSNYAQVNGTTDVGGVVGYADIMSDGMKIVECKYLKTDLINTSIFGIGNLASDDNCLIVTEIEQ